MARRPVSWFESSANDLRRAPLQTFMRGFAEQGDVVRFPLGGPFEAYLIAHPEGVDRVLRTEQQRYGKVPWHNGRFRELLGDGIATSEGDRWLSRRRLLQPAFHREAVSAMVDDMVGHTVALAVRWEALPDGAVVDMSKEMMELTLTIAARTLLGVDVADEAPSMGPHVDETLRQVVRRLESLVVFPLFLPTPANRPYRRSRAELDGFIRSIIERRRSDRSGSQTLLDILLDSRDADTGNRLTDTDIRDEVMTMLMAGHESTSVGLTWAWYLLAQNPEQFERLRAELDAVLCGRAPTGDDLPRLPFAGMVFDEALRLYPPAWSTTRSPTVDDEIRGRRIPKGKYVILSPYVTHRHPDFWPEPERFDPERFAGGVPRGDARFSYFPFGGGPRQCLGLGFALTEAKIVLAILASRFRPTLVASAEARLDPQVTLRPLGGLAMRVQ